MSDRKLNICLIVNEFPGLTETFITTKAIELSKRGHTITVIKNQENKLINTSHLKAVNDAGIRIMAIPDTNRFFELLKLIVGHPLIALQCYSFSLKKFIKNFKQSLKLKVINRNNFDIIHVEFSGLGLAYQKALEQSKAVSIVSCRGTAEKVKPLSVPDRKQELIKLFSTVKAIHCVSGDMANTIQKYCSDTSKIFINRPSIDTIVFSRKFPYPSQGELISILSVGRFTFQKGYLIGLIAIKQVVESGLSVKWTIVGDGSQMEEMIYHIHALQLQDNVILAGKKNRDEILEMYHGADVFLLCSVYEGIANVCLEAMSMELPVVATKSGGMEEVIDHGINGMLCNVYDSDSIADAIKFLAADHEIRKSMGAKARQKIISDFTIQQQADVFEQKYMELTK